MIRTPAVERAKEIKRAKQREMNKRSLDERRDRLLKAVEEDENETTWRNWLEFITKYPQYDQERGEYVPE